MEYNIGMYEHLKTCEYCQKGSQTHKPTITVKSASSYGKRKKLDELAAIIKGTSYAGLDTVFWTEVQAKLKLKVPLKLRLGESQGL